MKLLIKAVIGVVLIVVVALVLAFTCPDKEHFNQWAKRSLKPDSGSTMEKAKGAALSTEARWTADYEDHVLWATVDAYQGTTSQRFLGVAGTWFRLGGE